jgi:hypothetical protein
MTHIPAQQRAAALFAADFTDRIRLPEVPLGHLNIDQLIYLDDELSRFVQLAEELANNSGAGFTVHDQAAPAYLTPLGTIMQAMSDWATAERRVIVEAAWNLAKSENSADRRERLSFLIRDAAGGMDGDTLVSLAEEYRDELAALRIARKT